MVSCCCQNSNESPILSPIRRLFGRPYYDVENLDGQPRKLYFLPRSTCTRETEMKQTTSSCCQPSADSVVKQGDPFEIRVVGFQVRKYDFGISANSGNEIVISSSQYMVRNPETPIEKVHFHYEKNRKKNSHEPNTFVSVPESTSFLYGDAGDNKTANGVNSTQRRKRSKTKSVAFRLKVIEVDKVSKPIVEAISNASNVKGLTDGFTGIPFLGLVSPFLGFAGSAGRKAMERHVKDDKVLNEDMLFQLARDNIPDVAGRFLRYGYYFIMSHESNYNLYACGCNHDNMRLHLKVVNEEKYYPLKNVNYIVLQVSEPSGAFPLVSNYSKLSDIDTKMRNILGAVRRKKKSKTKESIAKEDTYILDRIGSFESLVGLNFDSD